MRNRIAQFHLSNGTISVLLLSRYVRSSLPSRRASCGKRWHDNVAPRRVYETPPSACCRDFSGDGNAIRYPAVLESFQGGVHREPGDRSWRLRTDHAVHTSSRRYAVRGEGDQSDQHRRGEQEDPPRGAHAGSDEEQVRLSLQQRWTGSTFSL